MSLASPGPTKTFDFSENGLAYTVTISQNADGQFIATINLITGSMDVNAVYFGDDDFSGKSASLGGPLNMNGGGSRFEGETVQWDTAIALSRPGLGREGTDKATFLSEGQSLDIPLNITSLDDIEFFGIRATSVNGGGSIKAVSGNPTVDEPEDPEDPVEPEDPTFAKVFFVIDQTDDGVPTNGLAVLGANEPPQPGVSQLPEGSEGTFTDYVNFFEASGIFNVSEIETVIFYDDSVTFNEVFRLEAPDGGFEDADALIAAFDEALEGSAAENDDFDMSSLFIGIEMEDSVIPEDDEVDEPVDVL